MLTGTDANDIIGQLTPSTAADLLQQLPAKASDFLHRWQALQTQLPEDRQAKQRNELAMLIDQISNVVHEELPAEVAAHMERLRAHRQQLEQAAEAAAAAAAQEQARANAPPLVVPEVMADEDLWAAAASVQEQAPSLFAPAPAAGTQPAQQFVEGWDMMSIDSLPASGDGWEQADGWAVDDPAVQLEVGLFGSPSLVSAAPALPASGNPAEPVTVDQTMQDATDLAHVQQQDLPVPEDAQKGQEQQQQDHIAAEPQGLSRGASTRQASIALDLQQRQQEKETLPLSQSLVQCMLSVLAGLDQLTKAGHGSDAALSHMLHVLHASWDVASNPAASRGGPVFVFRDGPATRAAKLGLPLLLEDWDAPGAAVTERLNSMLETEPSLCVSEDPTAVAASGSAGTAGSVDLLPGGLQVFATIRTSGASGRRVKLSAAARSRFTEVHVPAYGDDELRALVLAELTKSLATSQASSAGRSTRSSTRGVQAQAQHACDAMWELRAARASQPRWQPEGQPEVHQLLTWAAFVGRHGSEPDIARRVVIGASFFFLDHLTEVRHVYIKYKYSSKHSQQARALKPLYPSFLQASKEEVLRVWWDSKAQPNDLPPAYLAAVHMSSNSSSASGYALSVSPNYPQQLSLGTTGVSISFAASQQGLLTQEDVESRLYLTPTPSLLANMQRLFAAITVRAPLLLQGPPGIGKTAGGSLCEGLVAVMP